MNLLGPLLVLASLAGADVVHLRSGGRIEGKVTEEGDRVRIQTASGTLTIPRDQVERIERKDYDLPPSPPKVSRPQVALGNSYAHPFYAFKIRLPRQWQRGKEQGRASVSFWGPRDLFYQPRMDLYVETGKDDLADLVRRYKEVFRRTFGDVQFPFEETLTIADRTAYQLSAAFQEGDPPIPQQSLWTFVSAEGRTYILGFNCTRAWFERYRPMVDASMRSLRIYAVPAASREERQRFIEHYSRAEAAYRQGNWSEARPDFEEAARLIPGFPDLHSTLGAIHMREHRLAEAEACFRRAAQLDPGDPSYSYNLGVCLLRQAKDEGAVEALRRSVDLDPGFEPALTNLGAAYLARGLPEPARQALERAVAVDPESAPAHYNLGLAYERLDLRRDAEREYRQALRADPGHAEAGKALERLRSGRPRVP